MGWYERVGNTVAGAAAVCAAAPFLWPMTRVVEAPLHASHWLLVVLSAVANVAVLTYHHVVPAHPKFLVLWWRRAILHAHIASGSIEFVAGLAACALGGNSLAGTIMAVTALLLHVPSAFQQTFGVFGSRAIMRPSYLMCVALHGFCAAMLLLHPESLYWSVATFLLFNTYVWVRVFYFALDKFGLFADSKYTVAVIFAGVTTTPTVLGPAAMIVIALGWVVFMAIYALFFIRSRAGLHDLVRERARDSAYSEDLRALWDPGRVDTEVGRAFFRVVDRDGDGTIVPSELEEVLSGTNLPTGALRHFMEARGDGGRLTLDGFLANLWTIPELRRVAREVVFTHGKERSEQDKARFVFDRLDLDGDGMLGREELEGLLTEWSMPAADVRRWTRSLGLADGADIPFDLFFDRMRPIWRFIYYDVIEARYGSRDDLIQRAFAAWRDQGDAARVEGDLKHRLVREVPFLQGADEAFLRDMAAAFVEQEVPAGTVLFEEGDVGEDFWVVARGCVRVQRRGEVLGDLRAGASLGEGALLANRTRAARAIAMEDSLMLRASAASFHFLLDRHPQMRAVLEAIHEERRIESALRSVRRDLLTRVPFLQRVEPDLLRELAGRLERHEFHEPTLLRAEGDPVDTFYMVSAGAVQISRGGIVLTELRAGAFFGESALVEGGPGGMATVIAQAGAVLYGLKREDFQWLVAAAPEVGRQIRSRRSPTLPPSDGPWRFGVPSRG
ncbi:MAG TPA: cyclic nucleotide-binding domain-containing protein [Myxococcota bacterium]|nr:cyclic nucleotide-binding domain-containing protein [Myxococcota bacterium]